MAVSAPGDSPPDQGGGFLSWLQGLAPEAQSAIMRVMAQANPVSSANAATASPLATPSPVPAALAGGGPPVPDSLVGHGDGPPPLPIAASPPPIVVGSGGSSGGAGATNSGGAWPVGPPGSRPAPVQSSPQMGMPFPPGYGPETTNMPYPGQVDPKGVFAPKPTVHPAVARAQARVAAHINPRATALAPAAAAGSPFVPIAAQNQDWAGGALARYGSSGFGRQGTALDLSKLFGRG